MTSADLDLVERVRLQFPQLQSSTVFFENAGGSLVPIQVIEAVKRYLSTCYVNYGADYPESSQAGRILHDAHDFVRLLMNGDGLGDVVFGASTSQLLRMLADALADTWTPGDEVILCETAHEANANPWVHLERRGIVIKWWRVDPASRQCSLDELDQLIGPRTKVVAFPHVSNLLGEIVDVRAVTELVHRRGAKVVVDGVAYASHALMDMADWGCDAYVYSTYKVYGPHMACLFMRNDLMASVEGPNHFFVDRDDVPRKFELGNLNHEGCAMVVGLGEYFNDVLGRNADAIHDRESLRQVFGLFHRLERPPLERLMTYLASRDDVEIIGPSRPDGRVATVSFRHARLSSQDVSAFCQRRGIGLRSGHMYSYRLCEALGISPADGVVRASLVHYNTVQEVEILIGVLDECFTTG